MVIMRTICYGLIAVAVVYLQSCQSHIEAKQERVNKEQRLRNAAVYNTELGLAYLRQSDRPRAKQKLLTALDLAPDSPDVNVAMGYFLEKTGDIDNAKGFYKKALTEDPKRKQSLAEIAQIEMKLNHPDKALKVLQQYRQQVLNDAVLLALAINAAHQAGQFTVEKTFKARLARVKDTLIILEKKNEYDVVRE